MESSAILINSVEDHSHVLFHLSKNHALCDVIESVKKDSSKWIKTKGRSFRNFHWQSGYGAFSVSQSNVAQVVKYIEGQCCTKVEMSASYQNGNVPFIVAAHFRRSEAESSFQRVRGRASG